MKIMDLIPTERIELRCAKRYADHPDGWKDALPAALPDDLLLQITQAFRGVEQDAEAPDDEVDQDLAIARLSVAMVLTLNLMAALQPDPSAQHTTSQRGVRNAMRLYLWALEREIARRATGVAHPPGDFLDGVRACMAM